MNKSQKFVFKSEITESSEFYEHFNFIVDKGQVPIRIDKYLLHKIAEVSRSKIQQAAKANCILVNNKPVKSNYKVKPLDEIKIILPYPPKETEIIPQYIPLNIVYEDEDIIVINKQSGLVVHPAPGHLSGTLLNGLYYYFLHSSNPEIKPLLVHRIDKDTTGLLVVCKNEYSQVFLAKQFAEHSIERKYIALVWGIPDPPKGTIKCNIGRGLVDRTKMVCYPDGSHGKYAVTHYNVIEHWNYLSLVECILETGRTNQIRTHFEYIKHPLFNDEKHGGKKILFGNKDKNFLILVNKLFEVLQRVALHAKILGFIHPRTKKFIRFESDLPDDMAQALNLLKNFSPPS